MLAGLEREVSATHPFSKEPWGEKDMTKLTIVALVLAWVGVAASGACAASEGESRVEFSNNRLKVDGKPFFMYGCWGTPDYDYAEFRRRHFNTAFDYWHRMAKDGPKAAAAGLMVVPYAGAPWWSEEIKAGVQEMAKEDRILAWNIGDDLMTQSQLEKALKVREEIRAMDARQRPIMFDAIGAYGSFAKVPDMWCAYAYPLVKPDAEGVLSDKPVGLNQYGNWLRKMRLRGREDCFFWTWAQCHVQVLYSMQYLGGSQGNHWRPSPFPDGDHLRLIAAHAISAGGRGLMWFVSWYLQDSHLGRDRYARAAVIGCELDVLGPLIAQGLTGERLETSDPAVWATPIDFPGGRLICLLKTGDRYHYQPDLAEGKDVKVETGVGGRVYQIGYDFMELARPVCSFDLTGWLLVTDDEDLVEEVRGRHQAVLPDMAGFAVEELGARLTKVKPVFDELGQETETIKKVEGRLARAREAVDAKDWSGACRLAEGGLRALREAQHRAWARIWSEEALETGLRLTDFYLLPLIVNQMKQIKAGTWGDNLLTNGSFESSEGWGREKLGHTATGAKALVSPGLTGKQALRMQSDSPSIYEGEPRDWVTADLVSQKFPARYGELWELGAWVRVPARLQQTARGLTIAPLAYSADGAGVGGYGAQPLEKTQIEATDGWKKVRLVVWMGSPDIASVAIRLSLCGVGEAYLDDVTVRRLNVPEQ